MNNIYTIKKELKKLDCIIEHSNSVLYISKNDNENRNLCLSIKEDKKGNYNINEYDYITLLNSFENISIDNTLSICNKFLTVQ